MANLAHAPIVHCTAREHNIEKKCVTTGRGELPGQEVALPLWRPALETSQLCSASPFRHYPRATTVQRERRCAPVRASICRGWRRASKRANDTTMGSECHQHSHERHLCVSTSLEPERLNVDQTGVRPINLPGTALPPQRQTIHMGMARRKAESASSDATLCAIASAARRGDISSRVTATGIPVWLGLPTRETRGQTC